MRLAQIFHVLHHEPLLCDNDYRSTLLELLTQHRELSKMEFQHKRTGIAKSGSELDVQEAEIRDGISIIPVGGPMAINLGEFEKGAGAVDMDDIRAELAEAELNSEVAAHILNIDSPGSTYNGAFELCDWIASNVEKPIYAFTRGTMCSGAYALACACDGIFATKSAKVGNIGVYTTFMDLSGMAEQKGIRVKVISSGPIKGMGVPGTSLSAEQEMFMKQSTMDMAKVFYSHVTTARPAVPEDCMDGRWFSGSKAVDCGMVDSIISDLDELVMFLAAK
jgi:signal peptide peptidase SppA